MFTRLAGRQVRRVLNTAPRRHFSGDAKVKTFTEADLWKKIADVSFIALIPIGGYMLWEEKKHLAHLEEHPYTKPNFPYLDQVRKEFPWKDSTCSLFDHKCKKALAAERAAAKAEN